MDASGGSIERMPSGISGLDTILGGGFLKGGLYIVQGIPGCGKTIFANQISFSRVAAGQKVVYVTLLSESHSRMLLHLRSMKFFNADAIPDGINYVSCFSTLEQEGLKGLLEILRREVRARKADLLVLDGLVAAEESAQTTREFKKFIHELQVHCNLTRCTVLLLTSGDGSIGVRPEHTMVDGIIELEDKVFARKAERELNVRKFRGSGFLRGGHSFRITEEGIDVFPRTEALLGRPDAEDSCSIGAVSSGIPSLDKMMGGGIPSGSSTLLLGPPGSGKTTLGLQYLSQCTRKEKGLLFGFYETPARLVMKAKALGLDLEKKVRDGSLEVLWQPPTERILDELGQRLLSAVQGRGVRRLFVDGMDGFIESSVHKERISHFFTALSNDFRIKNVTSIFSSESPELIGHHVASPLSNLSVLVENIVLIRIVETSFDTSRMLSVVKVRDSG